MGKLSQMFSRKPYLAWEIRDKENLSKESILEHILNYGDWEDYLQAEAALGIKMSKSIFENLKNKKRVNLKPRTVNYFEKYFQKYA